MGILGYIIEFAEVGVSGLLNYVLTGATGLFDIVNVLIQVLI
jgi:hypothetical protein